MRWLIKRWLFGAILAFASSLTRAAAPGLPAPIQLPAPHISGGKPLMQALMDRRTSRDFRPDALPRQTLANLLWAAFGVNRPASGGRTAPSAHDAQDIDVYVVLAGGAYLYIAKQNTLTPVRAGDLRALTGRQAFVRDAPVSLVYVADFTRFPRDSEKDKTFYSAADAGHISQNVYLFAASEGLATMVRAYIDKPALARSLGLRPTQRIVLAQSVGYPK
jgi:SagB-type dehydrogenase family enzyme